MARNWSKLLLIVAFFVFAACAPSDISIISKDGIEIEGRTLTFIPSCKQVTKQEYCMRPHALWRKSGNSMVLSIVDVTARICNECKAGNNIISARYTRTTEYTNMSEEQLISQPYYSSLKIVAGSDGMIKCNEKMCETWIVEKGVPWNIIINNNGEKEINMVEIRNSMKAILKGALS